MPRARGLSELQRRILQLALANYRNPGMAVPAYLIKTSIGQHGTAEADFCIRCVDDYLASGQGVPGTRWAAVEDAIRGSKTDVGRLWREFDRLLVEGGASPWAASYPRDGTLILSGRLEACDWRRLRPLLTTLRDSGFTLQLRFTYRRPGPDPPPVPPSQRSAAWHVTFPEVLAALYPAERQRTRSAEVTARKSLDRLVSRGLLLIEMHRDAFVLTGEGLAVATGEDGGDGGCILEAASKMQPQRKRGRPAIDPYSTHDQEPGTRPYDERLTERMSLDHRLARSAFVAFRQAAGDMARFAFIFGTDFDSSGRKLDSNPEGHLFKVTLAAELARLIRRYSNGMECALKVAEQICAMRPLPTVKQAVRLVRQYRGAAKRETSGPGDAFGLEEHLTRAMDDYLDRHPGTPPEVIEEALQGLGWFYVELPREEANGEADPPATFS